jgi:hypothetical protein
MAQALTQHMAALNPGACAYAAAGAFACVAPSPPPLLPRGVAGSDEGFVDGLAAAGGAAPPPGPTVTVRLKLGNKVVREDANIAVPRSYARSSSVCSEKKKWGTMEVVASCPDQGPRIWTRDPARKATRSDDADFDFVCRARVNDEVLIGTGQIEYGRPVCAVVSRSGAEVSASDFEYLSADAVGGRQQS